MTLIEWSWAFLVLYIAAMVGIGLYAQRRIKHADDFATARGAYGPFFLALAFAASTASGATFLGSPALSYEWGLAANWGKLPLPHRRLRRNLNLDAIDCYIRQSLRKSFDT